MRPPVPQQTMVSSYVDQLNRAEQNRGKLIKAGALSIGIAIVLGVVLAVISLSGNDDGGGAGGGGGRQCPIVRSGIISSPALASPLSRSQQLYVLCRRRPDGDEAYG